MNYYGGDSPIFILIGKMFNAGKIPYVEFFDHKGPVLIFLEAIGLRLTHDERLSIFILQIINLYITQILIYKIAKTYLSHLISLGIVMLTLLVFSFTIQGGNLTEEWSLPYLYFCLLITIHLDHYSIPKQKIYFVIMGICTSILFWMRLNNTGVICACILSILIIALKYKNRKQIYSLIFWGSIGFIAVSIPIIIYFICVDAFSEMIYASFIFNFKYVGYNIEDNPIKLIDIVKRWLSLFSFVIGSILYYKKYKDCKILVLCICLLFVGFVSTHIGPRYFHYMTLNLPLFSFGMILIFSTQRARLLNPNNNILMFITSFLLLFGYTFYKKNQEQYINDKNDTPFIQNCIDIADRIPADQKCLVFTYNVRAEFWLITNELPNYKYFVTQEWHGFHDKNILIETNRMIQEKPPLWIIIPNLDFFDISYNPEFYLILSKEYQENYRNNDLILLKRVINN